MKSILLWKHWQVFLLLFVLPVVLQFGIMFYGLFTMIQMGESMQEVIPGAGAEDFEREFMQIMLPIIIISILLSFITFGWLWIVGTQLHSRLPASVSMNLTWFQTCVFYPVVYFIAIAALLPSFFKTILSDPESFNPGYIMLIIPFHLIAIGCIIYSFYFCAKALKSVELQRPVSVSDFILEIVFFWFFMVGVWFIQPRLNAIFGRQSPPPLDPTDHLIAR